MFNCTDCFEFRRTMGGMRGDEERVYCEANRTNRTVGRPNLNSFNTAHLEVLPVCLYKAAELMFHIMECDEINMLYLEAAIERNERSLIATRRKVALKKQELEALRKAIVDEVVKVCKEEMARVEESFVRRLDQLESKDSGHQEAGESP